MTTATITQRIARAIAPLAYEAQDRDPASLTETQKNDIRAAEELAVDMTRLAAVSGFEEAGPEKSDLGTDMKYAKSLVEWAVLALEKHKSDARGDLDELIDDLSATAAEIEEKAEDIACDRCGEYNNDGEGFNGLCGDCADQDEAGESAGRYPRESEEHPTVGDRVAMMWDEDTVIEIAEIPLRQPNLRAGVWTIIDQYGEHHHIEDETNHWETVNPATRTDVVTDDGEPTGTAFEAIFVEDGIDDGDGIGMRNWRGVLTKDGEPVRSTDLLYLTSQEACIEAMELDGSEDRH